MNLRNLIQKAPILATAFWTLLALPAWHFKWFDLARWELRSVNMRFQQRGPIPTDPRIVLVAIDEASVFGDSLDEDDVRRNPGYALLKNWPYPRQAYAEAIEKLAKCGARAVVFDLILSNDSQLDDSTPTGHRRAEADNARLTEALIRHHDKVVLGANISTDEDEARGASTDKVTMPQADLLPSATVPDREIVGYVNYPVDEDGCIRRMQPVRWSPLFELNAPLSLDALAVRKAFPDRALPEPYEPRWIYFTGPFGTYQPIPFYQLFDTKAWEPQRPPLFGGSIFKDKIVLIGPRANFLHDEHLTPFGRIFGVDIHADAIATLLSGKILRETPPPVQWAILLLMGATLALGLRTVKSPLGKLAPAAVLGFGYWGAAQAAFVRFDLLLPLVPVGLLVGASTFTVVTFQAVAEQIEKRRVSGMLHRYVSRNVAEELIRSGQDFNQLMTPRKRTVTILFSDVRDFTTMTEGSEPGPFVQQLNEYLTAMVECVFNHGGTLDKFVGDAVMAVFGNPRSRGAAEDAWCAVQCALEMRIRLAELNQRWQTEGRPPFRIGIGLNHGEVMAGDIGSRQKAEFGVIGDAVNVAARVESLTKEQKTDILITDSVFDLVKERVEIEERGEMKVKGRHRPVHIHALKSLKTAPPQAVA